MIFSGGEPLMRNDIYQLIERAAAQGLRPVLGSNGTMITRETANKLKAAGAMAVGISLDSTDPRRHDDFRCASGAWESALAGMEACREAGLPFQVHTTVLDWNSEEIERLTDLATELGARGHHIFFMVPAGRAVNIEAETLRAREYEELLERIIKKQSQVDIELKPTCAPQFMRIARQLGVDLRFTRGCLAGTAYCIINPQGQVQPCAYLDIPLGSVRQIPFGQIWRENEVLNKLRTMDYSGGCGQCEYKKICGGCRARAYFYHGDYMAEEPWCLYRESKVMGQ
ncbi:MAG: radical SAM protein, partial [Firmicutes bacterium]|nr:radical SAM protein [Bacillota bacterium]